MNFKNNQRRINFPVPVLEESVKKEKITTDRSHAVDAAIVRIMKSRKKMSVVALRIEVITIMQNFKPAESLIKKRIEFLIEREYLERDKQDPGNLVYKA